MRFENLTFDEERTLYGIRDAEVVTCSFEGPSDGESALKESGNIRVRGCRFLLRYPLWHVDGGDLRGCVMTDTCRAALWYGRDLRIEKSALGGIKALRECDNSVLTDCAIDSPEFGWFCRGIQIAGCSIRSEYLFLHSRDLEIDELTLNGKYSFQYVEDMTISNSELNTKDAFWHGKNVTVVDSVIRGEYLGWYSENLKLIRCTIIGTQPLCYAKNLMLEDCEMADCDLSFEKSDVMASVHGTITSVKNPWSGSIIADRIGEIILDADQVPENQCQIQEREPVAQGEYRNR
jgi:Protein of unknown function (DUF3737).